MPEAKKIKWPADAYWVVNGTMVEGRRLLRMSKKKQEKMGGTEGLMRKISALRKAELKADEKKRHDDMDKAKPENDPTTEALAARQPSKVEAMMQTLRNNVAGRGTSARRSVQIAFREFDRDNSGTVDRDEFSAAVEAFLQGVSKDDVGELFDHIDRDGSGL